MSRKILLPILITLLLTNYIKGQNNPELDIIGSQSVVDGSVLFFQATASDIDGDELTFSMSGTGVRPEMSIDPITGMFIWVPSGEDIGTHEITVSVSDGTLEHSETISLTVNNSAGSGQISYVNPVATGNNDGSSWEDAFTDLAAAIDNAVSGQQLWIAKGTYTPTTPGGLSTVRFQIDEQIALYGGFSGTESTREQRNPSEHVTVLSGDLNNNDHVNNGNAENSEVIVYLTASALLDGFTITASNGSDGSALRDWAANSWLLVRNTIFKGNNSSGNGVSSIVYVGTTTGPMNSTFENCLFANNTSSGRLFTLDGPLSGSNLSIHRFYNSSFISNGLLFNSQRESIVGKFFNSLVHDAPSNYLFSLNGASFEFTSSIFPDDPTMQNPSTTNITVFDNNLVEQVMEFTSEFYPLPSNPAIDAGDNEFADGTQHGIILSDLCLDSRIHNGTVDMGAFEYRAHAPVIDPLGDYGIAAGSILYFDVDAQDKNEDPLTYSLKNAASGMDIMETEGVFSWVPDISQVGTHELTVEVSDGDLISSQSLTITVESPGAEIIYVDKAASGANDGTSWNNAFVLLQDGLNQATDGDQIWVTSGTYTPGPAGDRSQDFLIDQRIALYGGFNGTESSISDRNFRNNVTILSGDLGLDDESTGIDENAYHVLKLVGNEAAVIDGFTISAGHANGTGSNGNGAAILDISRSVLYLRNLLVENNTADDNGVSSIIFVGSHQHPNRVIMSSSVVRDNTTSGAVFSFEGILQDNNSTLVDIIHCNIIGNVGRLINSQRPSINTRVTNSIILDHQDHYLFALQDATNEFRNSVFDNDPQTMNHNGITVFESNMIEFTPEFLDGYTFAWDSPLHNAGNSTFTNMLGEHALDFMNNNRLSGALPDIGAVEYLNFAPVLNTDFEFSLDPIDEDNQDNPGIAITEIFNSNGGLISDDNFNDRDGAAISAVDNTNGVWQYSVDGGASWMDVVIGENEALPLLNEATSKVRFIPSTDFNGSVVNGITLRAWDQFIGTPEQPMDASAPGGNGTFSAETEILSIVINPVNDAPTVNIEDQIAVENEQIVFQVAGSDVDQDVLTYSLDSESESKGMAINASGEFSWQPGATQLGEHTVTVTVSDNSLSASATFTIQVDAAPALLPVIAGIDDISRNVKIYPNPTIDYIEIDTQGELGGELFSVSLFDLRGMTLTKQLWDPSNESLRMDLHQYQAGVYILKLQSTTTQITRRIIKE